jgi:Fe-S-cluster containining protein
MDARYRLFSAADVKNYRDVLDEADAHFNEQFAVNRAEMQCGRGCSLCCYGLFEISSSDVAVVVDGLRELPAEVRADVVARAAEIVTNSQHPNIREIEDDEKEAFFDRTASVPCPALDDSGACRIYANRPLVCRTFGLPIRDAEQYIGDICDLNFGTADQSTREAAAWDLQNEDPVEADDQYTIPEAILMADRILKS